MLFHVVWGLGVWNLCELPSLFAAQGSCAPHVYEQLNRSILPLFYSPTLTPADVDPTAAATDTGTATATDIHSDTDTVI